MCRKLACHFGLLTQARPQLKWNYSVHKCCHLAPGQRSRPWLSAPAILGLCTVEAKVSMFCFGTTEFTKSLLCVFIYVMWESPFQSLKKKFVGFHSVSPVWSLLTDNQWQLSSKGKPDLMTLQVEHRVPPKKMWNTYTHNLNLFTSLDLIIKFLK